MFRTTITADETSIVADELTTLRSQCMGAGVPLASIESISHQVEQLLTQLVASGKTLSDQGSQLSVTREIKADGCAVEIKFGAGVPVSSWRKLTKRLFGS